MDSEPNHSSRMNRIRFSPRSGSVQVQLRVEFDCALVLPVAYPVVDSQAQRYGRTVDGIERFFELEAVTGSTDTRAERILSGELGIENCFELTDGGEIFAVTVAGMLFHAFS